MSRSQMVVVCMMLWCLTTAKVHGEGKEHRAYSGLITNLKGSVLVLRAAGTLPASIGFILLPGDTIHAARNAVCSGISPMGDRFELSAFSNPATLFFPSDRDRAQSRIAAWVADKITNWGSMSSYFMPLLTRSARDWNYRTDAGRPIIPTAGGCVRASQSVFVWTTDEGIEFYDVTIAHEQEKGTSLTIRDHAIIKNDLQPGGNYYWKVTPKIDGYQRIPQWVPFTVMSAEAEKTLDASLAELPDLEAGIVLLSVGLHGEAIQRFDAAASVETCRKAALIWRAKSLAALELCEEAYRDLMEASEIQ